MKHEFEQKVYYGDTDAYGVVWHGSYLRWMEKGRIDMAEDMGLSLVEMQKNDIVLPVTNINIKYKSSAKLNETVIIETKVIKISPLTFTFNQVIKEKLTGRICTQADVEVVAVSNEGKLYRRLPDVLKNALEKALEV